VSSPSPEDGNNPVSETLCFLVSRIPDDGKVKNSNSAYLWSNFCPHLLCSLFVIWIGCVFFVVAFGVLFSSCFLFIDCSMLFQVFFLCLRFIYIYIL
jgi:hypothetical protein